MKALGIYDNTTIIITGDHGNHVSDEIPLTKATGIGLFYKQAYQSDDVLKYSNAPVSLKNLSATIAKEANLAYQKYGRPLDKIGETENIKRYYYKSVVDASLSYEDKLFVYEIPYDARDFSKWTLIREEPIQYSFNGSKGN